VIRRLAGAVLAACALIVLLAGAVPAEAPPGPRLALQWLSSSKMELRTVDATGGTPLRIAGGDEGDGPFPAPFSAPSWSADGSLIAFAGSGSVDLRSNAVYLVNADGTGLHRVPGTPGGLYPVLSPDGHTLAFSRVRERVRALPNGEERIVYRGYSIWLLDMNGGAPRQLTPWRNGVLDYPSSFSPDGSTLAISRERERKRSKGIGFNRLSAVAIRVDGSGASVLARNAMEPVYSPDGARLALIAMGKRRTVDRPGTTVRYTETELAVARADGSELKKLTKTPAVELQLSWDPSSQRLAYTHVPIFPVDSLFENRNSIMQINADGSCRTRVLSSPRAFVYGAVWQPGPGREAGRITC
jgi:Tol biopolymer transport system component